MFLYIQTDIEAFWSNAIILLLFFLNKKIQNMFYLN